MPSAEYRLIESIGMLFKGIFDVNEDDEEVNMSKAMMLEQIMNGSPECRKNFILCLQKFRRIGKF